MSIRRCPCYLLFSLLFLVAVGCADKAEEDHAEHHIPEHKPKSFADAVKEIPRRIEAISVQASAGTGDRLERELLELQEIIGWIPELAADSDMRRAPWEEVQAIGGSLKEAFPEFAAAARKGTIPPEIRTKLLERATKLRPFVRFADAHSATR